MFKSTKFWIILFSVLFMLGAGAFLLLRSNGQAGRIAEIRQDGELIKTIDLNAVTIPYDFTVTGPYGSNTIHVAHGAISVSAADCPDQICVQQGAITDSAVPIVCLPHRLVITIEGGS